jgi:hypothetical protein
MSVWPFRPILRRDEFDLPREALPLYYCSNKATDVFCEQLGLFQFFSEFPQSAFTHVGLVNYVKSYIP